MFCTHFHRYILTEVFLILTQKPTKKCTTTIFFAQTNPYGRDKVRKGANSQMTLNSRDTLKKRGRNLTHEDDDGYGVDCRLTYV